ncbi:MAG: hypothetical protein Q4P28_05235 [Tissierellia bacterium]|nr:hypothetical protein [Tissierellia bacterium]
MKKMIMSIGKVLVFFILWSVSVGLVPIPEFSNPAIWRLFAEIIPLLITILWTFLFILFDKVDIKCDIKDLFSKKIVLGFLLGLLWLGLTIAIIYAFGGLSIVSKNSIDQGYIWFIALFFNTIMQELAIRGYIYTRS